MSFDKICFTRWPHYIFSFYRRGATRTLKSVLNFLFVHLQRLLMGESRYLWREWVIERLLEYTHLYYLLFCLFLSHSLSIPSSFLVCDFRYLAWVCVCPCARFSSLRNRCKKEAKHEIVCNHRIAFMHQFRHRWKIYSVSYTVTKSINGYSLLSLECFTTLSIQRLCLIRIQNSVRNHILAVLCQWLCRMLHTKWDRHDASL